jgi:uncharacterized protein YjbI with pentapeptide repeats
MDAPIRPVSKNAPSLQQTCIKKLFETDRAFFYTLFAENTNSYHMQKEALKFLTTMPPEQRVRLPLLEEACFGYNFIVACDKIVISHEKEEGFLFLMKSRSNNQLSETDKCDLNSKIKELNDQDYFTCLWLVDLKLSSYDFSGLKLCDTSFTRSTLTNTNLSNSYLSHAVFFDATLNEANFTGSCLSAARFLRATFNNVDFTEAILIRAHIEETGLQNVNASYVNLLATYVPEEQKAWLLDNLAPLTKVTEPHHPTAAQVNRYEWYDLR